MKAKVSDLIPPYYRGEIEPRLVSMLKRFGQQPFILYYAPGIVASARRLNTMFGRLENYRNMSAVKATFNPWIQHLLYTEANFGADVSSPSELIQSRAIGLSGHDIVYTGNRVQRHEFALSQQNGGSLVNYDDITAIDNMPDPFPKYASFRISPGPRRTGNSIIGDPFYAKYGITYKQIIAAYRKARNRGAEHFGIDMMVCSNERRSSYIVDTVREILLIAAMLKRELDIEVEYVDIGGGFGIAYQAGHRLLNEEWIGDQVFKLFQNFKAEQGFCPRLLTECGRYVTGPHGFLIQRVITVEQKYCKFIGVEAAMTAAPGPAFYGRYLHMEAYSPDGKLRTGPREKVYVAGPNCEDWDRLTGTDPKTGRRMSRLLPKSIRVGDIMVTHSVGAHSIVMASNYNGRTRPMEVLGPLGPHRKLQVIARAETIEDLFRRVTPSPHFTLPGQA